MAHRLAANPIPFFYEGGEHIERFRGEAPPIRSPEDWVASMTAVVEAARPKGTPPEIGISILPDGSNLRTTVMSDAEGWLGGDLAAAWGGESGLLVKLLDVGQRLPVHFHPSRAFAEAELGSPFGKTEAWIIMDDAPGGEVWLGFAEPVEPAQLADWVERQAAEEMLARMNRLPAGPGSVFFVPAGVPHAIGPGIMLTELQEPTAFSILAEHVSFGVDAHEATLGLGWTRGLAAADLSVYDDERISRLTAPTTVTADDADGRVMRLFADEADAFFRANRIELSGRRELDASFRVLVIESGGGTLATGSTEDPIAAGQTWVVPHGAGEVGLHGDLRLIECLPPLTIAST